MATFWDIKDFIRICIINVKGLVFKQMINPISLESTKKPECFCMFGVANFKAVKMYDNGTVTFC